jgi:hypothetical protein
LQKAGQYFGFDDGRLISLSKTPTPDYRTPGGYGAYDQNPSLPLELTSPFAVYGAIFKFWKDEKEGTKGPYGRPICDEQALADGGRCTIFEGGHIHCYDGRAGE